MKCLVLLLLAAAASASVINTRYCPASDLAICEIHEIRVDPCADIAACKIVRGNDAKISFDFTPHFTSSSLRTEVVYQGQSFPGLDSDGCKVTTCPTVAGSTQTYNATLHVGKKLPKGTFEFEWSVSDANNANNKCCLLAKVKLIK